MKIAILTQPLGANYGGILQNFALQYVLKDMGHEVVTINRLRKRSCMRYVLAKVAQKLIKHHTSKILSNNQQQQRIKNNIHFMDKHIQRIDVFNPTNEKLKSIVEEGAFDAVIVGSDQVWRPKYSPNIYNDFLDFLEDNASIKKVAYAASLGTDKWEYNEEETKRSKELAHLFDRISVREKSAVHLCKEYFNIDAQWVLDPTLLLAKEVYESLFINPIIKDESNKTLFTYILDQTKEKKRIVNHIALELDLTPTSCQPKTDLAGSYKTKFTEEDFAFPPIEDWIKGFAQADFVVTDSFHGTVMSIIFNKPFIVIVNKERGASRLVSLLRATNLESQLVSSLEEIADEKSVINYEQVVAKLKCLEVTSNSFLKNTLN